MMRYRGYIGLTAALAVFLAGGCSHGPADATIATQIKARFFSDPLVKASAISVAVNRGEVTLAGPVNSIQVELQALKLAMETEGVRKVNDKISIVPPAEAPKAIAQSPAPSRREPSAQVVTPPAEPPPPTAPTDQSQSSATAAPAAVPAYGRAGVAIVQPRTVVVKQPAEKAPAYAVESSTALIEAVTVAPSESRRPRSQSLVSLLVTGPLPPAALFERWALAFNSADLHTRLEYWTGGTSVNSRQFGQRSADMAVFGLPVSDEILSRALNLRALRFPAAVGGVVAICNLGGSLQALNLSGEVLAALLSGRIQRWDDAVVRSLNPQTALPGTQVTIVHRSDGSDETWLLAEYLSAISPDWRARFGASPSVRWPVGRGVAGNGGVLGLVRQTPDSLGYVDASFARQNGLTACNILNRAGRFVKAGPDSLTAAAAGPASAMPADLSPSIVNAPGLDAYPIAGILWLAVPDRIPEPGKREGIRSFLGWMLASGQSEASSIGYAPLPTALAERARGQISQIR